MDLEGRYALVTGGGTGLGAAVARSLARCGAHVAVGYRSSRGSAEEVAATCRAQGVDSFAAQADVADDLQCRQLVEEVLRNFRGLDILVNNAGITRFASSRNLDALDAHDFERLYRVNVIGAYQMTRAALAPLKDSDHASVINVSSIAGVLGGGSSIAYVASKGALNSMTLALARSLAPSIRVNAVCPGFIATDWVANHLGPERADAARENARHNTPLQRAAEPEDVAESIVFFASASSRNMTGELMLVDGGRHLGAAPLRAR